MTINFPIANTSIFKYLLILTNRILSLMKKGIWIMKVTSLNSKPPDAVSSCHLLLEIPKILLQKWLRKNFTPMFLRKQACHSLHYYRNFHLPHFLEEKAETFTCLKGAEQPNCQTAALQFYPQIFFKPQSTWCKSTHVSEPWPAGPQGRWKFRILSFMTPGCSWEHRSA